MRWTQIFPKALAKTEVQTNNLAHSELVERLELGRRKFGDKTQCPIVVRVGLQHTQRQSYEDLRGSEGESFVGFISGCDLHLSLIPAYALSTHVDFNRHIGFVQLPTTDFDQRLISPSHPDRAVSVDHSVSSLA